jgi:hypothetical protein
MRILGAGGEKSDSHVGKQPTTWCRRGIEAQPASRCWRRMLTNGVDPSLSTPTRRFVSVIGICPDDEAGADRTQKPPKLLDLAHLLNPTGADVSVDVAH